MAKPKRTKHQREKDLAELSLLEGHGLSHQELAAKFGVTKQQISYDLAILDRRFKEEQLTNTERRKRRRHLELERVKRAAWEGFERSRQAAETMHVETTTGRTDNEGNALPEQVKKTKTVKGQAGDPSFLEKIIKAEVEQILLWGDRAGASGGDGGGIAVTVVNGIDLQIVTGDKPGITSEQLSIAAGSEN